MFRRYNWRVQSAHSPRPFARRWWWTAAACVVAIAAAHLLDRTAWESWRDPRVNDRDWGRMLRSVGYLPVWIVASLALLLHGASGRSTRRRALFLLLAPALSGLTAEVAKLLFRRLRPDPDRFAYLFRTFTDDPFSTRNLGLPSSHVMVAFGGAFALAWLFPRTRWVWFVLAAGCAATRVLALGHFLSDTVTAAALAWVVTCALRARLLPDRVDTLP